MSAVKRDRRDGGVRDIDVKDLPRTLAFAESKLRGLLPNLGVKRGEKLISDSSCPTSPPRLPPAQQVRDQTSTNSGRGLEIGID